MAFRAVKAAVRKGGMPLRGRPPVLAQPEASLFIENRWGEPIVVVPYWLYRGEKRGSNVAVPFVLKREGGRVRILKPSASVTFYRLPWEEYGALIYPLREVEGAAAAVVSATRDSHNRLRDARVGIWWPEEEGRADAIAERVLKAIGLEEVDGTVYGIVHSSPFFTTLRGGGATVIGFILHPGEKAAVAPLPYKLFASRDGERWYRAPEYGEEASEETGDAVTFEMGAAFPNPEYYIVYERVKRRGRLRGLKAIDWKLPGNRIPESLREAIFDYEFFEEGYIEPVERAVRELERQVERGEKPLTL